MADTLKQSRLKALGRLAGDRFTNLSEHEPDELLLQLSDMTCDHASAILGQFHRAIEGKRDLTAAINVSAVAPVGVHLIVSSWPLPRCRTAFSRWPEPEAGDNNLR